MKILKLKKMCVLHIKLINALMLMLQYVLIMEMSSRNIKMLVLHANKKLITLLLGSVEMIDKITKNIFHKLTNS